MEQDRHVRVLLHDGSEDVYMSDDDHWYSNYVVGDDGRLTVLFERPGGAGPWNCRRAVYAPGEWVRVTGGRLVVVKTPWDST